MTARVWKLWPHGWVFLLSALLLAAISRGAPSVNDPLRPSANPTPGDFLLTLPIPQPVVPVGRQPAAAADPAPAKVNRTLPRVEVTRRSLAFSANPTTEEIARARLFEEPLVPTGGEPRAGENAALVAALRGYAQRHGPDDFSSLTDFLDQHPNSPWRRALLTDLGLEYYNTAHYSLALQAWREAWSHVDEALDAKPISIRNCPPPPFLYLTGAAETFCEKSGAFLKNSRLLAAY